MSDSAPKPQSNPRLKRMDGPPKPPTKTTLDLMEESEDPPREDSPTTQMVTAVTNATVTYGELLILNGGGRQQKRESLELSLDRNVILLSRLVPNMRGKDLDIVTRTLRDIREYRGRFPRSDASNREQAEQARKILDEMR
jgi:hypothetical protein